MCYKSTRGRVPLGSPCDQNFDKTAATSLSELSPMIRSSQHCTQINVFNTKDETYTEIL